MGGGDTLRCGWLGRGAAIGPFAAAAGGSARGAGMGWLAWVRVLSDLQGRRLPAWSRTQGVFAARSSDFQPPARNTIRSSFMINVLIVERASRW
jgi:hypothetical protein